MHKLELSFHFYLLAYCILSDIPNFIYAVCINKLKTQGGSAALIIIVVVKFVIFYPILSPSARILLKILL